MSEKIVDIKARQVLDSKGRPVVEVDVITENGVLGRSGASTGTSVGKNESFVLRDGDASLFGGISVFKAVQNIEEIIKPALIGTDVTEQEKIDRTMIELDGTRYKTKLGGNTIYAVSCAAARAGAKSVGKELWEYMAPQSPKTVYTPAYNMINGGTYGKNTLAFQEFLVIPKGVDTFYEGSRIGVEIFYKMAEIIKKYTGKPAMMGNYSGYGAPSEDPFTILDMLTEAAESLGYKDHVIFSMDCASSEIYDEKQDGYLYRGKYISREELIDLLAEIARRYPIGFIEDALQEEDFEGFAMAQKKINAVLIGDDFICSSVDRAQKAFEMNSISGMILKPNQAGTLTEAIETVRYMKERDLLVVGSGRAGGVLEDPIGELAVALGVPLMKTGAPRSGERTIFTNTALRIEEKLKGEKTMTDVTKIRGFERFA